VGRGVPAESLFPGWLGRDASPHPGTISCQIELYPAEAQSPPRIKTKHPFKAGIKAQMGIEF